MTGYKRPWPPQVQLGKIKYPSKAAKEVTKLQTLLESRSWATLEREAVDVVVSL